MPGWLISIILMLGKPALIAFLKVLEKRFPGVSEFVDAIIKYLEGSSDKAEALERLNKHCEGLFCAPETKD